VKKYHISEFVRGWFVGGFEPSIIKTTDVEVAVQYFKKGDKEKEHCHKIATEITVILKGNVIISGKEYSEGDILEIFPGEYAQFEALEDTITVVVKYPGASNDKYIKELP
jgi:quercetin dioxygenase-like cupin family protein